MSWMLESVERILAAIGSDQCTDSITISGVVFLYFFFNHFNQTDFRTWDSSKKSLILASCIHRSI